MNRAQRIEKEIQEAFHPEVLEIIDESTQHAGHAGMKNGAGGHFKLKIVSSSFLGMPLLKRHQAVYAVLRDMMSGEIHALSLHILTPDENSKA